MICGFVAERDSTRSKYYISVLRAERQGFFPKSRPYFLFFVCDLIGILRTDPVK
jgi:hypothetical protein